MLNPCRFPWSDFPDVLIHTEETLVKKHPAYAAAKSGDVESATALVSECLNDDVVMSMIDQFGFKTPTLISVHAEESVGINAIPEAMAEMLSDSLNWDLERFVVQANVVNHTGANGFSRLARQALFKGKIVPGVTYVIVDDFIGQGGTIANLRGHILSQGGEVIGATVLTGKPYSRQLTQPIEQLKELRKHHGQIEEWWTAKFGFGFDCLTASEARYLIKTSPSEKICASLSEFVQ